MDKKINDKNISRMLARRSRIIGIIVACLVLAIAFPGIVRAAIAVINTTDGSWDGGWGNPMRVDGDDAGVTDDVDIDTFWVNTDASSPTTFYFGVSTVDPLRTYGGVRICVKVDCNGDNDFTDAEDRVLEINPGDTIYDVIGDNSGWELNSADDGEFVSTRYMEARTNNSGSIVWSGCMASNPLIKAEVRDDFCPNDGTLYDETVPRSYDLPTAIRLQNISVRAAGDDLASWLGCR